MAPLFARRATAARSSAIRDLLAHAARPGMISMAGGLPDPRLFPLGEIHDAAVRALHDPANVQYGLTAGEESVRSVLAAAVAPDISPDRCVVTTGSQQALDLLARVLIDEGDEIVVSEPDYLGTLQAVATYGARLAPVALDDDGIDTDALAEQLRAGLRPKLCYTVPHFHNPSGSVLAAERRRHLVELARRYEFVVVEDDPYRELWFDTAPSHAEPDEHVVFLRSASKTLAPGLRVGWMVASTELCDAVVVAKQSADLHTSTLSQAIVADCLDGDWFPAHLDRLRADYAAKREALMSALEALTDDIDLRLTHPAGGMFCWAHLGRVDTARLLDAALDEGVAFVPGTAFSSTGGLRSHLRLSFATATPDELREGVARLVRAINRTPTDPAPGPEGGRLGRGPSTRSEAGLR